MIPGAFWKHLRNGTRVVHTLGVLHMSASVCGLCFHPISGLHLSGMEKNTGTLFLLYWLSPRGQHLGDRRRHHDHINRGRGRWDPRGGWGLSGTTTDPKHRTGKRSRGLPDVHYTSVCRRGVLGSGVRQRHRKAPGSGLDGVGVGGRGGAGAGEGQEEREGWLRPCGWGRWGRGGKGRAPKPVGVDCSRTGPSLPLLFGL